MNVDGSEEESENQEFKIGSVLFVQTCYACPEQYDVYIKKEQVGYIRLRHGRLSARYPDVAGDEVYSHSYDDKWQGCFDFPEDRMKHLKNIGSILEIKHKENQKIGLAK